ncbi:MAG: DUF373 family protein [Candidatus ainarchaeum sp.]|nr:DUF373 family protein [Candidatus ainarchaeum sp.]
MENPVLVLCIDRDNDLFEKAKIHGPVIGREENLKAATKLALADPEDSDANAIFSSIKLYDEIKSGGKSVVIATLTGHKKLGYRADLEISKQLDKIIEETHADSCAFISDGASDEEILPIVKSRIRINSSKVVVIKQAKELEKTYFVILEKLKDPYYARIILGVPAMIIFLLSLASQFGYGWQPIGILVGTYLILKGFGIDERIGSMASEFKFSIDKTSWIAYTSSLVLLVLSAVAMYQAYMEASSMQLYGEKIYAYAVRSGLLIIPWALLFILVGKALDARAEKRKFLITRYGLYGSAMILTTMMLKVGCDWILNLVPPYVNFSDFLLTILISLGTGYVVLQAVKIIREETVRGMKLEGKEIIGEGGSYIGKVVGVNMKEGRLIIQTPFERKINVMLEDISSIGDKIVVRQ